MERQMEAHEKIDQVATKLSAWLNDSYPTDLHREAIDWRRMQKMASEVGEALDAYSGMIGENPRKGITHGFNDVLGEVADVALTAIGILAHFGVISPTDFLRDRAVYVLERVGLDACPSFKWIGQTLSHCDECSTPAWKHNYVDTPSGVKSWDEDTIELWRSKGLVNDERAAYMLTLVTV